jgi:uncharacterized membrane protein
MEILTKLSPVLYALLAGFTVFVVGNGFIKSENIKSVLGKLILILVLVAMVKKPERFGNFGEMIINLITTIVGYFA